MLPAAVPAFVRARMPLLVVGVVSELIYLLYLLRTFPLLRYYQVDTDLGQITQHTPAAFWTYLLAFTVLFALLGVAWRYAQGLWDAGSLALVLGFGAVFALTQVFVYPLTAIDIFCYVAESAVMTHYHQNPLFVAPDAFLRDPLMPLCDGWSHVPSVYGPLGTVVSALPSLVVEENLLANLILLKLLFSAMALACAYLVYRLLQRSHPALALSGALLVAWNPLILFQVSANGHNDIVMTLCVILGLVYLADDNLTTGATLFAAAALVKYSALPLVPLALAYGVYRHSGNEARASYLLRTLAVMLAVAAALFYPFWRGPDTLNNAHVLYNYYLYSFGTFLGSAPGIGRGQAALVGRILYAPLYLYTVWLATRSFGDLVRACFLAAFFFLALASPVFLNWYGVWPIIIAAAIPSLAYRIAAFLFSWAAVITHALFGYLWYWQGVTVPSFTPINNLCYVYTFLPPTLLLIGWYLWARLPAAGRRVPLTPQP